MVLADMVRKNRNVAFLLFGLGSLYLLISTFTSTVPSPRAIWKTKPDICSTANFQWRGANDKIYPRSGAPVSIIHKDYSDSMVNHDVSVLLAHSMNDEYTIDVEVFTSHEILPDDFSISYSHDELILYTAIPKTASFLNDEKTKGKGHCVVIKVSIMVPTSKPLSGLKLDFPTANVYIHESLAGSIPYFDVSLGSGDVILAPNHRFHVESLRFEVLQGRITGHVLLTKSLVVFLQNGQVDLDIAFSPYLVGAEIEVTQQGGSQQITLDDLWYRPVTGTFILNEGNLALHYPKSYAGRLTVDIDHGRGQVTGAGLDVTSRQEDPFLLDARQGHGSVETKVHVGTGKLSVLMDEPTTRMPMPELIEE